MHPTGRRVREGVVIGTMRVDAQRNRERLLLAARDVFVDLGADAPLDEIARQAGVGIATLYRRFPVREALMRAVAVHVLTEMGAEARAARNEEADPFAALSRFLRRALDLRIAAVMPVLGLRLDRAVPGVRALGLDQRRHPRHRRRRHAGVSAPGAAALSTRTMPPARGNDLSSPGERHGTR
jgi:AcrR family transcriptional regulator